jgi:ribosomal protein S18 acetylase RimI-like enzyme
MDAIPRIQTYMRQKTSTSVYCHSCTPFSFYINPDEGEPSFAIPDVPVDKAIDQVVTELQVYARARNIPTRVRCIEEYIPEFVAALRRAGFGEVWRQPIMHAEPDTLLDPETIPGLSFMVLSSDSPLAEVRTGWITDQRGFGEKVVDDPAEIEKFRRSLTGGRAVVALMDNEPAAAAMFTDIRKGVAELIGISTVEAFRRRGIAAAVSAHATRTAFNMGAEIVFLTTQSDAAARIYERIGFTTSGWLIEMSDNREEWAAVG